MNDTLSPALLLNQPRVNEHERLVLRFLKCGDAYRAKRNGAAGRRYRERTLRALETKGLAKQARGTGLWKIAPAGTRILKDALRKR